MGVSNIAHQVRRLAADKKRLKKITNGLNRLMERGEEAGMIPAVEGFDLNWARTYPELVALEEQYAAVREECEQLLKLHDKLTDVEALGGNYTKGGIHSARWKSFMFKSGRFVEENCRLAPRTSEILRSIPNLYTAFFSILEPHQYITPHWGYYKGFVRFHLGVVVPSNNADNKCWLRINCDRSDNAKHDIALVERGHKYYWKNGEGMLFDDTFLHDAKNESDETRVVLWLDVARSMPAPLHALNTAFLKIAHQVPSIAKVRRQSIVRLD